MPVKHGQGCNEKDGGNGTDHQRVRAGIELRPQETAQHTFTKMELEWFERDRICENGFCPFVRFSASVWAAAGPLFCERIR